MGAVGRKGPLGVERRAQAFDQTRDRVRDRSQFPRLVGNIERSQIVAAARRDIAAKPQHRFHSAAHGEPDCKHIQRNEANERPQHSTRRAEDGLPAPLVVSATVMVRPVVSSVSVKRR